MIYQHPLAYLLGLEGVALLRAFAGEHGREFTQARLKEIRALLDAIDDFGDGVSAAPISTQDGYRDWAPFYDQPGNALIDREQPVVRAMLDDLEPGIALDAACGTGRHTAYLAQRGHRVIGVDSSPDMLAIARAKVPDASFHEADLAEIPLPDDHVDLVVCALALTHVDDLAGVLAELVRVLKPGGHLVLSDSRGLIADVSLPLVRTLPDGTVGYLANQQRLTSDYLAAALPLGLEVRRCEEPRRPWPFVDETGTPPGDPEPIERYVAGQVPDIWSLHPWCPEATNAAYAETAQLIVWDFQLRESPS